MAGIFQKLLPREEKFFELFTKQTSLAVDASRALQHLISEYNSQTLNQRQAEVQKIKEIEHQGDLVTHEIIRRLDRAFITPFDKEDIHQLAVFIDDIIDIINTLAGRFVIFNIEKTDRPISDMGDIISTIVQEVYEAVIELKTARNVRDRTIRIHGLENKADEIFQKALSELFQKKQNPIHIVKYKEIYELLEQIPDKCDVVARIIESIAVKYG